MFCFISQIIGSYHIRHIAAGLLESTKRSGQQTVVGVDEYDVLSLRFAKSDIPCGGNAYRVGHNHANVGMAFSGQQTDVLTLVIRTVDDKNDLKICHILIVNTVDAVIQVFFRIMDGNNDAKFHRVQNPLLKYCACFADPPGEVSYNRRTSN